MIDDLNLLTAEETAKIIGKGISTLERWKAKGIGPVGVVIDGRTWWTRKGIAKWEDNLPKDNQTLNPALR